MQECFKIEDPLLDGFKRKPNEATSKGPEISETAKCFECYVTYVTLMCPLREVAHGASRALSQGELLGLPREKLSRKPLKTSFGKVHKTSPGGGVFLFLNGASSFCGPLIPQTHVFQ